MTNFAPAAGTQLLSGFNSTFQPTLGTLFTLLNIQAQREATQQQREFQNQFQTSQENRIIEQQNSQVQQQINDLIGKGGDVNLAKAEELRKLIKPLMPVPSANLSTGDDISKRQGASVFDKVKTGVSNLIQNASGPSDNNIKPPEDLNNLLPPTDTTPSAGTVTPDASGPINNPQLNPIQAAQEKEKVSKLRLLAEARISKPQLANAKAAALDPAVTEQDFREKVAKDFAPKNLDAISGEIFKAYTTQREKAGELFKLIQSNPNLLGTAAGIGTGPPPGLPYTKPDETSTAEFRNYFPFGLGNAKMFVDRKQAERLVSEIQAAQTTIGRLGGAITSPEIKLKLGNVPANLNTGTKEYLDQLLTFDENTQHNLDQYTNFYNQQGFDVSGIPQVNPGNTVTGIIDAYNQQEITGGTANGTQKLQTTPEDANMSINTATSPSTNTDNKNYSENRNYTLPEDGRFFANPATAPAPSNEGAAPTTEKSFVKQQEGFSFTSYKDGDKYAVGYGSRYINGQPVKPGMKVTQQEAEQQYQRDIKEADKAISASVRVNLSDTQKDALRSFIYNAGTASFERNIAPYLNKGDIKTVTQNMMKVVKSRDAQGNLVTNPTLVRRRQAEVAMLTGRTNSASPSVATSSSSTSISPMILQTVKLIQSWGPEQTKSKFKQMNPQQQSLILQAISEMQKGGISFD